MANSTEKWPRRCGILCHPTCFPSPFGIGDFGEGAYRFVDFASAAGQSVWQILPLGPTGYGDSPYQPFSAFAGNPLLIDPRQLVSEGLLTTDEAASGGHGTTRVSTMETSLGSSERS